MQGTAQNPPPADPRDPHVPPGDHPDQVSGGSYPVGVPEDEGPERSDELEPAPELEIPEEYLLDPAESEEPPIPRTRREIEAEDELSRESLNDLLRKQIRRDDLKPDELARFVEVVGKLNGLFGKGDIDIRRLSNEDLLEKWGVVAPTLERLGLRIDFETGRRPKGRPRKAAPAKTVYGSEFIGRTWAKPASAPEAKAV